MVLNWQKTDTKLIPLYLQTLANGNHASCTKPRGKSQACQGALVESAGGRLRILKSLLSLLVIGQSIILIATPLGYDPPAPRRVSLFSWSMSIRTAPDIRCGFMTPNVSSQQVEPHKLSCAVLLQYGCELDVLPIMGERNVPTASVCL